MVSGALSRGLAVLEVLAQAPAGRSVQQVADTVDLPKSAAHRILVNLVEDGYARQDPATGEYRLTLRLVSLAMRQLATNTLVGLARPVLERLARTSGELVRLSLVDGDRLIWVAKAQGATAGLRYDPDPGAEAQLSGTANGLAWLSGFSDERALEIMLRQGLADPGTSGPHAPTGIEDFLGRLRAARADGYARVVDSFEPGASAMAAPVLDRIGGDTVGVLSIAGPTVRFTLDRMLGLAPALRQACAELTGVGPDAADAGRGR
jgi:DNA-binding IclR family transcriptional regulator